MKTKISILLLTLILVISIPLIFIFNNQTVTPKAKENNDWSVMISYWGFFGGLQKFYVVNDSMEIDTASYIEFKTEFDSTARVQNYIPDKITKFTLTRIERDSIFLMTNQIFKNFEFSKTECNVQDGLNLTIRLQMNNTTMSCNFANLTSVRGATDPFEYLSNYLKRKLKRRKTN